MKLKQILKFMVENSKRLNLISKIIITALLFAFGLGVLVHDYIHALWQVGGYWEILSIQGGYIGFFILVIAFLYILKVLFDLIAEYGE